MFNLSKLAIVFSVGTSLLLSSSATAQLVPDRTLGRESSKVQRNVDKKPIVVVRPRREDSPLVIQQARGWIKKSDGTIVLTAYSTEGKIGNRRSLTHPNCSSRSSLERF